MGLHLWRKSQHAFRHRVVYATFAVLHLTLVDDTIAYACVATGRTTGLELTGMYRSTAAAVRRWMIYAHNLRSGIRNAARALPREALRPPVAIDSYDTHTKRLIFIISVRFALWPNDSVPLLGWLRSWRNFLSSSLFSKLLEKSGTLRFVAWSLITTEKKGSKQLWKCCR
jgi:hypothetical protein